MQTKDMTTGSPAGLILRFALPLMLGNVFQQFYTFVDTMVVGQALGVKALAALGAAEWLTFLMFGLVQGLVQGFSPVSYTHLDVYKRQVLCQKCNGRFILGGCQ